MVIIGYCSEVWGQYDYSICFKKKNLQSWIFNRQFLQSSVKLELKKNNHNSIRSQFCVNRFNWKKKKNLVDPFNHDYLKKQLAQLMITCQVEVFF